LAREGFEVFCLKGSAATYAGPSECSHLSLFDTNDDLLDMLEDLARTHQVSAVFHVAALCDYQVKKIKNEQGNDCRSAKIASRSGCLNLVLKPATKVISRLRGLFPRSLLVGWKYELSGTREAALAKAWRQIEENMTDACVLNGAAYGPGFAVCRPSTPIQECENKSQLIETLAAWLSRGNCHSARPNRPVSLSLERLVPVQACSI
jgi:hypothetical protein